MIVAVNKENVDAYIYIELADNISFKHDDMWTHLDWGDREIHRAIPIHLKSGWIYGRLMSG